jgi:hypothetical protein
MRRLLNLLLLLCCIALASRSYGQSGTTKTESNRAQQADEQTTAPDLQFHDPIAVLVSAPAPAYENCSVPSPAKDATCECGPNKVKKAAKCVTCSTPSGKACNTLCQSCYTVCANDPAHPPEGPACGRP